MKRTERDGKTKKESGQSRDLCVTSSHWSFGKVATDVITNRANRCSFLLPYDEGGIGWLGDGKTPVGVKQTILNVIVTDDIRWSLFEIKHESLLRWIFFLRAMLFIF